MYIYRKLISPLIRRAARGIYHDLRWIREHYIEQTTFESNRTWKNTTTMDHAKLVEEHLRCKAYFIAEKDGFKKNPVEYWEQARKTI